MRRQDVRLESNPVDANASVLVWGSNRLPLPVAGSRVAVGQIGSDRLAVLAAGVREALVVYVVDSGGAIARLATDDGRRLPPSFNGEGSWPLAVGRDVFVVAYEKDLRIEVRAFGFGGKMFAARTFPAEVRGFDVSVDTRLHRVQVLPDGVAGLAPLDFLHPLAPRIELEGAVLDFGAVPLDGSRRVRARLRNPTTEAIDVDVRVVGAFRLDVPQVRVGPSATEELVVEFWPQAAREERGQLLASYQGLERPLVLPLRGVGVRVATVAEASFESARPSAPQPKVPATLATNFAAPDAPSDGAAPERSDTSAPAVAAADRPSPPVLLLRQVGDQLVVRGRRGELLLLAAVTVRQTADGPQADLPLAAWRVRLSAADGCQRVALAGLHLAADMALIAVRRRGSEIVESELLQPDLRLVRQSGD